MTTEQQAPAHGTPAHHAEHPSPTVRTGEPIVRAAGLTAGYAGGRAFADVSFEVSPGNLVALIGPNGSGKSTLIKTLVGLIAPWEGTVSLWGREPAAVRDRIGYMPQVESVDWQFPVTVRDVVAMGLYRPRWGWQRLRRLLRPLTRQDQRAVAAALERLAIGELADSQVGELSGGQQRRVLLARTIVKDPELLLLDEPAAGLDAAVEEDLLGLLLQLAEDGKTLLVATHDLTSVFEHYPLTICLNGRLVVAGRPAEVLTEEVLVETFGRHLMVFHQGDHGYTVEPHVWHGEHEHE